MKNILVCGANGFIGRNVVKNFYKKKKYKIFSTYFRSRPSIISDVKWIKADLRNFEDCLKATKNIDIVIQCAATTSGAKDIINQPYLHVTDNAVMNSYLLRACYQNKIKHFIFFSCTVMYKNSKKTLSENQVEEDKIYPNYYGVANTKLYIEKICKFYSSISKTKFSILRHSNIYGPYDKFNLEKGHFLSSSIFKVLKQKSDKVYIFGSGKEKRDFLHVNDLMNIINLLISKQKNSYEIFNCSYGKSFSVIDILKKIINLSNSKKNIHKLMSKKSLKVDIMINSNKAKRLLNWYPKIRIDKGLKMTIDWFIKNSKD
jgi:nucleoside-diphosphate-sugar epimerase